MPVINIQRPNWFILLNVIFQLYIITPTTVMIAAKPVIDMMINSC
jgi:hypothetical protein